MGSIFISHSSKDRNLADAVAKGLHNRKITSQFLDHSPETGIAAAADWEQDLYRRLWGCSALVALVTDHYMDSHWCFAELCLARMRGKKVVTLLADPLKDDDRLYPQLSVLQRVDARNGLTQAVDALVEGFELAGIAEEARFSLPRNHCPYPGLKTFEADDAGVFFGRNEEIRELEERLRRIVPPGAIRSLLVVGGSGVGKSSLLRAGFLPRQHDNWNILGPFRPGAHPIQQLAFAIEEITAKPASELEGLLRAKDTSLARLVGGELPKERRKLPILIVIDQLEELLSEPAANAALRLSELTCEAASELHGNVHLVGSLRTTDLDALNEHPVLRVLAAQELYTLAPIQGSALRKIITGPADKAGLRFEDGLVGRILDDMSRSNALPLLAYTLHRLWEHGHQDQLLTIKEYEDIGGLEGAIATAAEGCVIAGEKTEEALRSGLLRLARVNIEGQIFSRSAAWSDLTQAEQLALTPLVSRHLLTRDLAGETGIDTIRVAHEALFRAWNRLSQWIQDSHEQLTVAHQLERAEALWQSGGRQDADLWRGARLRRARELLSARRLQPSTGERIFLEASNATEDAERMRQLEQQKALARNARAAMSRGLALQAQWETNPARALLLALSSAKVQTDADEPIGPASEQALRDLLGRASGRIRYHHPSPIRRLWAHPQQASVLAQYEDGIFVWIPPAESHHTGVVLADPPENIEQVGFGTDGSLTVLAKEGAVKRWLTISRDGPVPQILTQPGHVSYVHALAPDGSWLAIAGVDGIYFTSLAGPIEGWQHLPTDQGVSCTKASPDGRWIVAGDEAGGLMRCSTEGFGRGHFSWKGHDAVVRDLALNGDANVIVSAGDDGTLRRFALELQSVTMAELPDPAERILCLETSHDGNLVALGSWFSIGQIWTARDGFAKAHPFRGLKSSYGNVSMHPDGNWLLAASSRDHEVHLWSESTILDGGDPLLIRGAEHYVSAAIFLPTGAIVTGDYKGSIREHQNTQEEPGITYTAAPDLNHASMDASVSRLLCSGKLIQIRVRDDDPDADKRAVWVDLHTGNCRTVDQPDTAVAVCQAPDGSTWVVADDQGELFVHHEDGDTSRRCLVPGDKHIHSLSMDPSGRWLLVDCWDRTFLYDLVVFSDPMLLEVNDLPLQRARFSPDGRTIVAADPAAKMYHIALSENEINSPEPWGQLSSTPTWLCGLSDGLHWAARIDAEVVLLGGQGKVRDRLPFEKQDASSAVFGPEVVGGRWLIHSDFKTLRRWDLLDTDPAGTMKNFLGLEREAFRVAISTDGSFMAAAEIDGAVRLWRPAVSCVEAVQLNHGDGMVMILAFRQASDQLVTMDANGVIRTWDIKLGRLCERARSVAGRDLTKEEQIRFLGSDRG